MHYFVDSGAHFTRKGAVLPVTVCSKIGAQTPICAAVDNGGQLSRCAPLRRTAMPKGQQRSNREKKKPKQPKKPVAPVAPWKK
jgi:hypothetical protein